MKLIATAPFQIAVKRETTLSFGEQMNRLLNRARMRAYELFEQRGRENGHALDDWVQAESELGILPAAKIDESEREIHVRIDRSDFTADELNVYVEPRAITVEAPSTMTTASDAFQPIDRAHLFGHYELPAAINTDLVKATLRNGVLEIVAPKTEVHAAQPTRETGEPTSTESNSEKARSAAT